MSGGNDWWEDYLHTLNKKTTEISLDNSGITDGHINELCDLIRELNIPVERISLGSNPYITSHGIHDLVQTLINVETLNYLYLIGSLDSHKSEDIKLLVELKRQKPHIIIYAYKTHEIEPANVNAGRIVITK